MLQNIKDLQNRKLLIEFCVNEEMSAPSMFQDEKYTKSDYEMMISANVELLTDDEVLQQLQEFTL